MEAVAFGKQYDHGEVDFRGETFMCDAHGSLFWPTRKILIVSDLHLEKGSAMAARGSLIPPYDTLATLMRLKECITYWQPETVISLGDSFHNDDSAKFLPDQFRAILASLMQGVNWVWIAGNHDPNPPDQLSGEWVREKSISSFHFRHEQCLTNPIGEISGHLHPAAKICRNGKTLRRRCFVSDGERLIMPAFGAFTGGLNVHNTAFDGLFDLEKTNIWMLGKSQVYKLSAKQISP